MNKILLVCLLGLSGAACTATNSKNVESTILSQNIPVESSSVPSSLNDNDYIVSELKQKEMKKSALNRQPKEIIEYILQGETAEKRFGNPLGRINVRVEDRDLSYDGNLERIIFANVYGDESTPLFYVFSSKNGKWSDCIFEAELGFPDGTPFQVELLAKSNKSDFDLIKISDIYGDKEVMKDVVYYQMKKIKYEMIECRKVEGSSEKTIPCN